MSEISLEEQVADLRRVKHDLERENEELKNEADKKATSARNIARRTNKLETSLKATLAELHLARHRLSTTISSVDRMLNTGQWEDQ